LRTVLAAVVTGIGLLLAPGVLFGSAVIVREFHIVVGATSFLGFIGWLLIAGSWLIVSASWKTRGLAVALLAVAFILNLLTIPMSGLLGWRLAAVVFVPLTVAVGVAGWLVLRGRPRRAYLGLLFALLGIGEALFPSYALTRGFATLVPAIVAWLAWTLSLSRDSSQARRAELAETRNRAAIAEQARAIQQWQAAYALANPGQPVPAPPLGVGAQSTAGQGTSIFAILSLVFGIAGGLLAIVFGHIALSEIKKTGQAGYGMAVAGLVLGYGWLAIGLFAVVGSFILILI
jgi:hypothetical protein